MLGIAAGVVSTACIAAECTDLCNWFNDPFFQVSASVASCPVPRGPVITKSEMQREAHVRSERGTRCWLEGRCARSNSYLYDQDIATELRRRLENAPALKNTSVWVTVQRRWVWLQGCVSSQASKRALERIARDVPDVERVFVELGTKAHPAYAVSQPQ